jgi:2-phosphoglycerate kinase
MRGIMVHSLMSKGVSFDDAYRAASAVRERIRGRSVVTREELARELSEVLDSADLGEPAPPGPPRDVLVTGQGRGTPFSKGFLSQSLLAAAVEPNEAFDVAREIEAILARRGLAQIDRHELRRLAYEALHTRFGARAAARYLTWRKVQGADRPVIVLLGGAAGVGKSALAQEVAHRLGIARVISTDSIRQVMRIMLSPDLVPAIHASSYDAWRALSDLQSDQPVVEGFRAQASIVSVGVRAIIDRAVAENASMVMEGVSVLPGAIDLSRHREDAHLVFLLVATLDPDDFATRFAERARTAQLRPPHRYIEHLDAILQIQDHLLELGEHHGVPIVENESFDASVLSIIRHVTESLRERGEIDAQDLL